MLKLLFLLLKWAKLGKVLLTSGTMLLSIFAYSLVFHQYMQKQKSALVG